MYGILGYLGVALFAVLAIPYPLRLANKKFLGNNKQVTDLVRSLKKIHKIAGFALLLVAFCHAFMATGGFAYIYPNGLALFVLLLITIAFAIVFGFQKKKIWLTLHRAGVLVTLLFLANHILFKLF